MKKLKTLLIFAIAIFAISCNENRIFEEHKSEFSNYRWEKSNKIEFHPQITDNEQNYQIYAAIRHVYGFQLKSVKINLEITSPSGKKSNKKYDLQVFKNANEYISDCAGDYCDLEVLIEDNFKFKETGKYTYSVSHEMKVNPIPNVMQVGLIVDKKISETKR